MFGLTCNIMRESKSKSKSRSNVASVVENDGSSNISSSSSSISSSGDIISEDTERKINVTRVLTSQSCLGLCFILIGIIQASSSDTTVGYSPALAINRNNRCGDSKAFELIAIGTVCFLMMCTG